MSAPIPPASQHHHRAASSSVNLPNLLAFASSSKDSTTTTTAAAAAALASPSAPAAAAASAHHVSSSLLDAFKASVAEVESYLALFEHRARIEDDYVRALKSLAERHTEADAKIEARLSSAGALLASPTAMPGARAAWRELRDNDLREIDTRIHYVETLRHAVIAPLVSFRDAQERIRKRCKEDLKVSLSQYDEMRNATLPKARRNYERRCEELEQIRLQQAAVEEQKALLASAHLPRNLPPPPLPSRGGGGGGGGGGVGEGGSSTTANAIHHAARPTSSSSSSSAAAAAADADDGAGQDVAAASAHHAFASPRSGAQPMALGSSPPSSSSSPPALPQADRRGGSSGGTASGGGGGGGGGGPNLLLEALRSKEGWEAARKEAPKKINAFLARMREGAGGGAGGGGAGSGGGVAAGLSVSPTGGAPGAGSGYLAASTAAAAAAGGQAGSGGVVGVGGGEVTAALGAASADVSKSLSLKGQQQMMLKSIKAKKEAEEADKAYRKAVFDLETLRLRRSRTLSAAAQSVRECRQELYHTAQAVWLQAERSALVLSSSHVGLHTHAEEVVAKALTRLDEEMELLEQRLPSVDHLVEEHVPYVNFWHGPCKDLLFGVSLIDYAFARSQHAAPQLGPTPVEPPRIVTKCIEWIEARALDQPGLYRISAKHSAIQSLANEFERDEARARLDDSLEPAVVAGLLKSYLRQLPEPLFPVPWEERIKHTLERQEHMHTGFAQLKGRIRRLPQINQVTLKAVVEHLAKVASHSHNNKMGESNLSVVFGPVLLSEADHENTSLVAATAEDRVMEDMIVFAHDIFDNLSRAGAPILPPVARGEAGVGRPLEVPRPPPSAASPPSSSSAPPLATADDAAPLVAGSAKLDRSDAVVHHPAASSSSLPPPPPPPGSGSVTGSGGDGATTAAVATETQQRGAAAPRDGAKLVRRSAGRLSIPLAGGPTPSTATEPDAVQRHAAHPSEEERLGLVDADGVAAPSPPSRPHPVAQPMAHVEALAKLEAAGGTAAAGVPMTTSSAGQSLRPVGASRPPLTMLTSAAPPQVDVALGSGSPVLRLDDGDDDEAKKAAAREAVVVAKVADADAAAGRLGQPKPAATAAAAAASSSLNVRGGVPTTPSSTSPSTPASAVAPDSAAASHGHGSGGAHNAAAAAAAVAAARANMI